MTRKKERLMDMPNKKSIAPSDTEVGTLVEVKEKTPTRRATKTTARRTRPPLTPELYVENGEKQYDITNIIERAKEDYRATHKVGVQSCRIYIKPDEGVAYYVINKLEGKITL
jgi:hypothetical protein